MTASTTLEPADVYTTGQVAAIIGCGSRKAAQLIDSGEIPGWRIGRDRRVLANDLDDYCRRAGVRSRRIGRAVVVRAGGSLSAGLTALLGDRVTPASGVGHAGILCERKRPGWLVLDLGVCDRQEALALARHVSGTSSVRVAVVLPDGEAVRVIEGCAVVLEGPCDVATLAREVGA